MEITDWEGDEELFDDLTPEQIEEAINTHPGNYTQCPECGATFNAPDMRETDDPTMMDYHCPICGEQYAHWHKTKTPADLA